MPDMDDFSIAHAGSLICLAVSLKHRVGLDCEPICNSGYRNLWPFFHPLEQHSILHSSSAEQESLRLWTRKEALLKACGTGLSDSLPSINCLLDLLQWENSSWKLNSLYWDRDYLVHLCWKLKPKTNDVLLVEKILHKDL